MKAIQFERLGGPEVIALHEVAEPELLPGTVLVRNRAIAVNFGDLLFLRGEYLVKPRFPDTPGMEAAGVVAAVAPDVSELKPGMRVAYIGMGAYAELTRIRHNRVMALPDEVSFEQGAGFPIAALTAWHLLHSCHRTGPGQDVIVHSAAGGIGIAALQIAKAAGARVLATASSADKLALARTYGADFTINYETEDFAQRALELTAGRGVDLILDAVGAPTIMRGLQCLAPFGHLVLYGRAGGIPEPLDARLLYRNSLTVSGFAVPMVYAMQEVHRRGLQAVFELAHRRQLQIPIGGRFPLREAAQALAYLLSRRSSGKLLLLLD